MNDKGIVKTSEFPIKGHMQPIDQSACKKESENGRQLVIIRGFVHKTNPWIQHYFPNLIAVCGQNSSVLS